jgi:hypothetical protein
MLHAGNVVPFVEHHVRHESALFGRPGKPGAQLGGQLADGKTAKG